MPRLPKALEDDIPMMVIEVEDRRHYVERPSVCPHCRHYSQYRVHKAEMLANGGGAEVVLQCGHETCGLPFVACYAALQTYALLQSVRQP